MPTLLLSGRTALVTGVTRRAGIGAALAHRFPTGRWGTPEDAARLVGWLCSDASGWITGQTLHSEGGFRR